MDFITGFTKPAAIHEGSFFRVLRARKSESGEIVILKCPVLKYPPPPILHALRHEYAMLRCLDSPCVIRPRELCESGGSAVLVLEDFAGVSLEVLLSKWRLPLDKSLRLFLELASALADLHDAGIVHGDMAPQNILVGTDLNRAKIIDLGDARFMGSVPGQARGVRGHLGYLAPEQALRPGNPADPRADLYGLGVAFYRSVTGEPPFSREGRRGMMHGHVADQAVPPHELDPAIPQVVSEIILMLLAKEPEGRYQSAHALKRDLAKCLAGMERDGCIAPFTLDPGKGGHALEPLNRLHGRDRERAMLRQALEHSLEHGLRLCLVSGPAGIGKTTLVSELGEIMAQRGGVLAAGKFESQESSVPFHGLRRALRSLLLPKLGLPDNELAAWCDSIRQILNPTTRLLLDVLPEFEDLLGDLPELSMAGSTEVQDRMLALLHKLLGASAGPGRPLAVFLDDLQWVDKATLRFMEYLMRAEGLRHVFLVGAYRDDEVGPQHDLARTLRTLRESGAPMAEVALEPLEAVHVAGMVADALGQEPGRAEPLARAVGVKSGGNPFFVRQILQGMRQDGLLRFDMGQEAWTWDQEGVEAMAVPADAAKFLSSRLSKLPSACLESMRLAACVGNQFDLGLVAHLAGRNEWDILESLFPAFRDGLLHEVAPLAAGARSDAGCYAFAHDRIHQAAQALTSDDERRKAQYLAGKHFLETLSQNEQNDRIFEIAGLLNAGRVHVEEESQRLHLARLNLDAGRRANAAAAFDASLNFFRHGMAVLPPDAEQEHHELWFELHRELALAHSRNGLFDEAEALVGQGMESAWDVYEMTRLQDVLMQQYNVRAMLPQALETGLKALRLLGVPIDTQRLPEQIAAEQAQVERLLAEVTPMAWEQIPLVQEPHTLWPVRIIANLAGACFVADNDLWRLIVLIGLRLSLTHGNCSESVGAYLCFGMLRMTQQRDYAQGLAFSHLGCRVMDQLGDPFFKAMNTVMYAIHAKMWESPMQQVMDELKKGFDECLSVGATMYSGFSAAFIGLAGVFKGMRLVELSMAMETFKGILLGVNQHYGASLLKPVLHFTQAMQGSLPDDWGQEDEFAAGMAMISDLERQRDFFMLMMHGVLLAMRLYHSGDVAHARQVIVRCEPYKPYCYSTMLEAEYAFMHALVCCAADDENAAVFRASVEADLELMAIWTELSPESFLARRLLVQAELERLAGDQDKAMQLYTATMRGARLQGDVHLDGLANELAARLLAARGWDKAAEPYLRDAYACYQAWGAKRKVELLRADHPNFLADFHALDNDRAQTQGTMLIDPESLDLGGVLLASRVIAAETSREKLPATLATILVETTGASRGALFLINEQGLMLEARAQAGKASALLSLPAEECDCAPRTILRFVQRTGQPVILEDATRDNRFNSEYLRRNKPRSVLCIPIFHQGRLFGAAYLENSLTPCVFSRERVVTVEHLASQAAIAMENARLYESLAATAREIRAAGKRYQDIFDNTLEGIFQTTLSGEVLALNPAMARIGGYASQKEMFEGLSGRSTNLYLRPEVRSEVVGLLQTRGEVKDFEVEMLRKDGSVFWALVNARILTDPATGERTILGVLKDVTESRQAHERIHSLSRQLIESQENEKLRISRVLHDQMGQDLLSLSMGLSSLRKEMRDKGVVLQCRVEEMDALTHEILESVRDLAYALRPTILERRGLLEALHELGQSFNEDTGIEAALYFTGLANVEFSPELSIHLYRVVNEALANVKRHSQASRVAVRLVHAHPHLILSIEDDGVGLNSPLRLAQALDERRLGIQGMRERIHVLGGTLEIITHPGQGLKLLAEIPFKEELWSLNAVS